MFAPPSAWRNFFKCVPPPNLKLWIRPCECRKELFYNISSVVPSFNDMDEFQKFKFILSSNDLDTCKICILGVNRLYSINQDLKGKL